VSPAQPVETIPVRADEGFDAEAVARFLRERLAELGAAPLEVEQFPAGHSNLTYLLRSGDWEGVLRRPPLGPVAPSAHDMRREFQVLKRLQRVFPHAPRPYVFCDDPAVIGAPFYVMERCRGLLLDRALPPGWNGSPALHRRISEAMVETLVELHRVNWQAAGLGEIARPEGYLERQVHGWIQRYHRARTDEVPEMDWLAPWLVERIPPSPPPVVVHNDYKLNNVMLDPNEPTQVTAVLDWEMCTVGDPLSDLATTLVYCSEPEDEGRLGELASVNSQPGFLRRREVADLYARLSGRDLAAMDFYLVFAYFKVGVICQQIYYRWRVGQTQDPRFGGHGQTARNLIGQAATVARGGRW
jgi:aminoglycoside phosphotransferase (APT) family kinase protein